MVTINSAVHVAHVIPVMDPATGGPPAVVAALASELPPRGIHPTLICYDGWPGDGSRARVDALLAAQPNPVPPPAYLPPLSRTEVLTARHARSRLPALLAPARLVHIHGIWDPLCLAAASTASHLGIPYLLSTHGMLEPWAVTGQGPLPKLKKQLRWHLGWGHMLQHAAALHDYHPGPLTVLGHTLPTPVEVIPNGIHPRHPQPAPDAPWQALCQKHPTLAGARVLLSLGRLSAQKGTDLLLAAFAQVRPRHPDAVLLLAGADYGLAHLTASDRVIAPGPLYGHEKAAALAHACGFVLPSRHEGFSVAVLEAMAAGLPCVLSDACHFPEAAAAHAAEIVPAGNVSALADAIDRLLSRPDAPAMGARGRELVLSKYTWPDIARRYADLYRRLAAAPTAPHA